jgi:hypothetical protein
MERCAHTNSPMVDACDGAVRNTSAAQKGLAKRAVVLAALFGIAHSLGLREWTSALMEGAKSGHMERIGCSVYLFLYGSAVFVAPTLAIAAILLIIWDALGRRATRLRSRDGQQ